MYLQIRPLLMYISFMSDKIMPIKDAVEGYELFDKAKVQKGISSQPAFMEKLILVSGLRGSEIGMCLEYPGIWQVRKCSALLRLRSSFSACVLYVIKRL